MNFLNNTSVRARTVTSSTQGAAKTFIASAIAAAGVLLSTLALAASISSAGTTLTANQKGKGYYSRDNIVGTLTQTGKGGTTPLAGVKITVKDPKGNVVGTGTTNKHGAYDIDTTLDNVSGWTLTFDTQHIAGEMTL